MNDNEIQECQSAIDWLEQKYFTPKQHAEPQVKRSTPVKAEIDRVLLALSFIPADNYDIWCDVGMALKEGGFDVKVWDDWSQKSTKYEEGACAQKWVSFNRHDIKIATLYFIAQEHGFDEPLPSHEPVQSTALQTITASELMSMEFPPLRWAIEPILPEGLTVIAGPPKIGKSWLAYSIACAVSTGGNTLGGYETQQGKVLYVALEDNHRRLQFRLKKLSEQDGGLVSTNLELCCLIPRLDEGGLEAITMWLDANPNCRLVIMDTLARVSGKPSGKMNAYDNDTRALAPLQKLAIDRQIALVLITHLRKQSASDPLGEVMGSTGITGIADAVWLLKRGRGTNEGILIITGRDVEEQELAVEFNRETSQWTSLGDSRLHQQSQQRKEIIHVLRRSVAPLGPKDVAMRLGKTEANTKTLLQRMHKQGEIDREARGKYTIINASRSPRSLSPSPAEEALPA